MKVYDPNKRVGSILNDLEVAETLVANLTLDEIDDMRDQDSPTSRPHCPSFHTMANMLPDDILIEIFLHLPTHPTCLLRASLVCKQWRFLITDHEFIQRFCAFHQTPPVLGIFTNSTSIPRFLPIGNPPECVTAGAFSLPDPYWQAEDGGLGLAAMTGFNLQLWAWEIDSEGVTGWVLRKTIELGAVLPLEVSCLLSTDNHLARRPPARILGLVEEDDLFFIWTASGVFAIQLKSLQSKKAYED
ncbi:hypothetical protein E2562_019887 [Oryza meyeriana var. granulata]|uniref:F-box domain-containing protein n=1 Tax=Oryza meyeriana var. granulata TaxID=110450 RepID=A0A6G1EXE6_9ORYZ|nr:hypothetical protein E2562_019887 [Oryza meyeriana var. granulata]